MNDLVFRITFSRQINQLSHLLIVYTIAAFAYVYYIRLELDRLLIGIILFFFLLDILPTLIAHVQYCLVNWGSTLIINKQSQTIRYISGTNDLFYHFEDIERLVYTASYGGGSWYSFSEYRYYRIKFKDQKEIVITSLMMKDIKYVMEPLLGISADKKLKLVAFI